MRFLSLALLILAGLGSVARADSNLPIVCTAGAKAGDLVSANTCTTSVYAKPTAASLVRNGTKYEDATWKAFGTLAVSDTVEVCQTPDVPPNTPMQPNGSPCQGWQPLTVASLTSPAGATGTITLTWELSSTQPPATSVWLYSASKGGTLSKLKQIDVSSGTKVAVLTGYAPGDYIFGITAANTAGESPITGPIPLTIDAPKPQVPGSPTSLSIVSVTIK